MWEVAFEHHGVESSWAEQGRQAEREGIRKRGAQGDASGAQHLRVARQAGYWGVPAPDNANPQQRQAGPPAAWTPRDASFPHRGARQAARIPRRAGAHQLPVPASSVQRRARWGEKNGQDQTLSAHPKSQPHPLYPSAQPPRDGPRGPPPGPPRGSSLRRAGLAGTWARVGVSGGARGRQGAHRCVTRRCPAPEAPSPAPQS